MTQPFQHNDIHHNNTHYNDPHLNSTHNNDTLHTDTQQNDKIVAISIILVTKSAIIFLFVECHYDKRCFLRVAAEYSPESYSHLPFLIACNSLPRYFHNITEYILCGALYKLSYCSLPITLM
jgi:hypothetical protein